MSSPSAVREAGLVRAIGVRALTAAIINATIGAGIFVIPAEVAASLGTAAPVAYLACAVLMLLVVTSFAMAGSRVTITGGLFAYVEVAFGPYVGFLAGVLQLITGVLAVSAVAAALVQSASVALPDLATGWPRVLLLAAIFGTLATINVRGVRHGARTVELVTLAKLLPLAFFVVVGLFFVDTARVAWPGMPPADAIGRTALVLVFAFVGAEIALAPSGEMLHPSRTVPMALLLALALTTTFYLAIQLVAHGVLGEALATSTDAPLARAASVFLGPAGLTLMLAGSLVSMFGYLSGDILSTPRTLFAFARDGLLPAPLARVHPEYRTPHVAIVLYAATVTVLASLGTFGKLAVLSNVAVLSLYLLGCLAALQLWRRDVRGDGQPFHFAGAPAVPVLGAGAVVWLLSHATREEFTVEAVVLVIASVGYLLRDLARRRRRGGAD